MSNRLPVLVLLFLLVLGACGESVAGDLDDGAAGGVDAAVPGEVPDTEGESVPVAADDSLPDVDSTHEAAPAPDVGATDANVDESSMPTDADSEGWSSKTVDELIDPVFVVDVGFGFGVPTDWYEQVWMKPGDGQGEITGGEGVRFTGRGGSTRSGIMTDVGFDVGDYPHLVLAVYGAVLEQGLSGTGWHGREAPLAVLVTYVDTEGTQHVGLGEDPSSPTTMFFRGFTALPEADMVNGVAVEFGEPFVYQFDLMELDPVPAEILAVGIEGAGWDPRVGEVYEFILAAGF